MALKLKGSTSGFVALDSPAVAGNNTITLPDSNGSANQVLANDNTAGVTTFTQVTINRNGDIVTPGTISIGGTLTYEDVTNVDVVGLVTAAQGVRINGGGLSIIGVTTGLNAGLSTFTAGVGIADSIFHTGDTNTAIRFPAADTFTVETGGSERIRVDSGGRLLIGTTDIDPVSDGEVPKLISKGTDSTAGAAFVRHSANTGGCGIYLAKSRNATIGSNTIVQDDDELGRITFSGDDGTNLNTQGAQIAAHVDGTPGANDMPGRLQFYTTADGAASVTERMRIDSTGKVAIGNASPQQLLHVWPDTANTTSAYVRVTAGDRGSGTGLDLGHDASGNGHVNMVSNGNLTLSTNNSARLFIKNTGEIGINTDSPNQEFEVHNNSGTTLMRASVNGNSRVGVEIAKTGATTQTWRIQDGQSTNGILEFYDQTDSRSVLILDGSGDITMGGATDADALTHVNSGTALTPVLQIQGTNASSNNSSGAIFLKRRTGSGGGVIWSSGDDGGLCFRSSDDNGLTFYNAGNRAFRIDTNEHCGINTTLAGADSWFTVEGTGAVDPAIFVSRYVNRHVIIREHSDGNSNTGLKIQKRHSTLHPANHWLGNIIFQGWDGDTYRTGGLIECVAEGTPADDQMPANLRISTNSGGTSATEALRISALGEIKINQTGNGGWGSTAKGVVHIRGNDMSNGLLRINDTGGANNQVFVRFQYNDHGNNCGGIRRDATSTSPQFFSGSDRRIKTNIADMPSVLDKINQVKIKTWELKSDSESKGISPIAQDLVSIFPNKVSKTDDGTGDTVPDGVEPWSIGHDYTWELMKSIQELSAKVETLQAEVATLKSA